MKRSNEIAECVPSEKKLVVHLNPRRRPRKTHHPVGLLVDELEQLPCSSPSSALALSQGFANPALFVRRRGVAMDRALVGVTGSGLGRH